ncbi:hypothetical protein DICPUDRAFT_152110 [Dictyostelium purpureum]|uniref:Uncharacterized protein n=1 Tax=Dictyostelium purpureum TaxID=5786 RepID=F0ZKI3_DICPU|nr:uncharacterized protein DICPUDRAFT_152110 [Dictyostelium purpureum]EGC35559.1 hypothetical protein DICPUDRAFT_152110 [Dictyostelium purpureum]|eukprot:XP_003287930.1 hypothetical protein DICPUDRAFT_152110 [Dictyostelium purpureum]
MDNSSTSGNPFIKKSFKGPLLLKDLQAFNDNGFLIKNDIIDNKLLFEFKQEFNEYQKDNNHTNNSNNNNNTQYNCHFKSLYEIRQNQNFYESYIQLLGSTYSDSYTNYSNTLSLINSGKPTTIKNVSFLEYPNFIHNFSPIELFMYLGNSTIKSNSGENNDKTINLDCNPFNLFKNEKISKEGLVYSNIECWKPIRSFISLKDNQGIWILPGFHKKSVQFIQDKYLENRKKLIKNLSLNGSGESNGYNVSNYYKNDKELLSMLEYIPLNKGDIVYFDWRIPKSYDQSLLEFIDTSFLPNVLINQQYIQIEKDNYKNGIITLNNTNNNNNTKNTTNNINNEGFLSKFLSNFKNNNDSAKDNYQNLENNKIKEFNNENFVSPKLSILGEKLLNFKKWETN